jgi:predicted MFS family arabinose efflux permease
MDPLPAPPISGRRAALLVAVAVAVGVAFADSSIVVLALPELYARFDTTIEGVAWVITSYNLVVAVAALGLVLVVHRVRATLLLGAGAAVFLAASIVCASSGSLGVLVAARSVQGLGAALLLAGSLPVLGALAGGTARGVAVWTMAGTFGAAVGPALGGVLTQAFDWRAIFIVQAPIAGIALLATFGSHVAAILEEGWKRPLWRTMPANVGLALVFGALVGALFLGVLLVINVFGSTPVEGALIVSAIPVAALLSRPLAPALPVALAVGSGALLLAAGLIGLALLPSSELGYSIASFALCGVGLGLAVPGLTHSALEGEGGVGRRATFTVGMRHLGLVLALAVVAPILSSDLFEAADVATLNGTAVVIDGEIPAATKIPLALDIRDELDRANKGEIPDFTAVFEEHGAATDSAVRAVRDEFVETIERAVTRAFRPSFLFCALLAALTLVPVLAFRRRFEA